MKHPRRRYCEVCKSREMNEIGGLVHEPVWAMQYIAEDKPSFYKLGEHIRGFGLIRICNKCYESLTIGESKHERP